MKRLVYAILSAAFMMLFVIPKDAFAANDTLVVYATPIANTLDKVVAQDQASATPHLVYQLVSVDTPYTFDATVAVNNSVTFIGKLGANNRPPTIQPDVLPDATIPGHLFTFTKARSVVKLKNLYLIGISINNSINSGDGFGVTVSGDSIKTIIDNVVFEQWSQFGINYSGNWDSFVITNCKFRNFVNPGSDYTGEALRFRNDLGHFPTDSIVMKYNTFLGLNGYVAAVGITSYMRHFDFQHNTVVGVFKNPFFNMNATSWTCDHNIFYAAYAGGMANGEYPWWDRIWAGGLGAVIDLDTLNKAISAGITDTTKSDWLATAEAARKIEVNDNLYYMPSAITSTITAWNADTASNHNWIYTCPWMNDYTQAMFANHSNFHQANNQNVDPQFGTGIATMIGGTGVTVPPENGIGLIPWLRQFRGAGVATDFWGYKRALPDYSSGNWKPTWPLPEETAKDLKYSASLTAADGKVYGDPYWFTGLPTGVAASAPNALPNTFSLSAAYPNPFNPSTNFKYTLNASGMVSLKIYNILGQAVKTVVNQFQAAGEYHLTINMSDLTSGVYFGMLEQGSNRQIQKMVLMK
jgi:hypothetical protein